ncbi:hypothetical protein ACJIZ3_021875 [Penstemon smallii]|uniref:C2H2-type domain-containing protein n=1 Tax=Penstemon smallii TaxID=265156 RepID=A0ABD3SMN4_9LAMI
MMMMMKGKRSKRPRPPSPLSLTITSSSSSNSSSKLQSTTTTTNDDEVEEDGDDLAANCLMLLAEGTRDHMIMKSSPSVDLYECKTCNKSFHSFQALGGHIASHKKLLLSNINNKQIQEDPNTHLSLHQVVATNRLLFGSRVHECSICGAEFGSGQALGGHMRRHRQVIKSRARNMLSLDLNLPAAPELDDDFPYATKKLTSLGLFGISKFGN